MRPTQPSELGTGAVTNELQPAAWTEIPQSRKAAWNTRLRQTDASLYQYPYWNEQYRGTGAKPVCLCWTVGSRALAYVCVLTVGFRGLKVGLVMRGPVFLNQTPGLAEHAIRSLRTWAAAAGYVFLRFTHSDAALLNVILAAVGPCCRVDAFPFHIDRSVMTHDLVIDQKESDSDMLHGFEREARRKIRRAEEVRYDIRIGASLADVMGVWRVFLEFFERRKIAFNLPIDGFLDVVRAAEPDDCVRVYSAWSGETAVEALLVFRDRLTALCHFAALDLDALGARPSPSVLLHWVAMRDMYRHGVTHYNLEGGTGTLWRFKQQFRPRQVFYPQPVTLIINRPVYRFWSTAVVPAFRFLKPCAQRIVASLHTQKIFRRRMDEST